MSDSGVFAQGLKVKVTNAPRKAGSLVILPCAMGFKNKEAWTNEWVEVVVFAQSGLQEQAERISKGDRINVSGRMSLETYNEKKSWKIYADAIGYESDPKPKDKPIDDVPF